jgi:5'-nucleotidase
VKSCIPTPGVGWQKLRAGALVFALAVAGACAHRLPPTGTVDVQILAFNDFHGAIEPPSGSNGRIRQIAAGGVEFLATHLQSLAATNTKTVIVSAGDNIGATPLISGMFHDEPSIEALSAARLKYSAVGNHELDEGWAELQRIQKGGCHPVDGCQDNTPFAGAQFEFLSANLTIDPSKADPQALALTQSTGATTRPLFAPSAIEEFDGVKIGFIGLTLSSVGALVSPNGMKGVTVSREAPAANDAARALKARGANAIVVLIHEGGAQRAEAGQEDPNACDAFSGPIIDIANDMSPDIDVVITGHTHRGYICTIGTKLVTSAASLGRLITDIDLRIDRATGRVVGRTARNVLVSRDVPKDEAETTIADHYRSLAARVASRPVGVAAAPITQARNEAGESALGGLVADGLLESARTVAGRVDVALTNTGGIRNDLVPTGPPTANGLTITYADVFSVLPFGNVLLVKTMTGDAFVRLLEQQFTGRTIPWLQGSSTLTYAFDSTKPAGSHIDRESIRIDGKPLVPTAAGSLLSAATVKPSPPFQMKSGIAIR